MNMRAYSDKQEKAVARAIGGRQTANSGATPYQKGDVLTDHVLVECKTVTKPQGSVSIKKEWLEKNRKEAFATGRYHHMLAFNFGPGEENYYIITEDEASGYIDYIEKLEKGEI